MHGTQTRCPVGPLAVALSGILGVGLGGYSWAMSAARTDQVIQRLIELTCTPYRTIPIWLALSAALPRDWDADPGLFRQSP